jgi:hypothetical protein
MLRVCRFFHTSPNFSDNWTAWFMVRHSSLASDKLRPCLRAYRGRFSGHFCSRIHLPFSRYRMGSVFLNNAEFHWETLRHFCVAPDECDDVISMSCVRYTAPVKVIRRNGRLFDRRRSSHMDMPAQSKCDKKGEKHIPHSTAQLTDPSPTILCHLHRTGDT